MKRAAFAITLATALLLSTLRPARAENLWKDDYRKATVVEASILLTIGVAGFVGEYTIKEPQSPRIQRGAAFDDSARDFFRAPGEAGRKRADVISDYGMWGLTAAPFLDAAITAWGVHGDGTTAQQLAIMDAEAFSLTEAMTLLTKLVTARQRPYAYDAGCPTGGCIANTSFPSGHTSRAFTGAALLCTTHAYLPMYGGPWDALACAAALGASTTTGVMRIVADKHWTTDVLAGAFVGGLSGWLVPTFFHFRGGGGASAPKANAGTVKLWPIVAKSPDGMDFTLGLGGMLL